MKKFSRLALIGVGAIGALVAIALLAVNLYVQSHGTQARIEQELDERLGTPVQIRRISVTPWWGLKLTGITMPQTDDTIPGSFLRADAFRLRIELASLFSGRLVIKEVSLVNPEVIWAQNAEGKWRLPIAAPAPAMPATEVAPPPSVTSAAPRAELSPPAATQTQQNPTSVPFKPELRRVNLSNGNFRFLDQQRKPVATFEGVRFRSNFRSATALTGAASIRKISLRDRFFLQELKSPISYDPAALDLSAITARAAGGEIAGHFNLHPADEGSPFTVMVKFRDLEADRVVTDAHGPMGMVSGKLEGQLDATGDIADPNALNGTGAIYLRDGQVRRYSLLVALGQILKIDEMMQLRLEEAHVKYHITPGLVTIDELILTSPNLRLSATGTVTFAGRLQLEAQLAINERIRKQLFAAVRENFRAIDLPGYSAVAFQITGTVDHPKTNLVDKVVGEELRDLGGVIDSIFGRRSHRSKSKAVDAATSSSPVPEATATVPEPTPTPSVSP
ncbi:MAG: AsmA-like C-terminal region-containing protein [Chthoniobacterales bacterium]